MTSTKTKLTYESYLKTPDDERYELLDGELLVMEPAPLTAHQYVLGNLHLAMRIFSDERNLGEVYTFPHRCGTFRHGCGAARPAFCLL